MIDHLFRKLSTVILVVAMSAVTAQGQLPIPVSEIKRSESVDFATEIMPLLKQNCLACHHAKESEGGLNLETHASMLAGGDSGPGIVPEDVAESLLMVRATGAEEPLMPPEDNSVGAKPFTPEQLGLLKLWIEQGAANSAAMPSESIEWQPIPESIRTIYAMDVSADGRLLVAGRANRAAIFDLHTKQEIGRLVDPALSQQSGQGVTDLDLIQSIAFAPDGQRIATGGYRTVKIWRKQYPQVALPLTPLAAAAGLVAVNADRTSIVMVNAIGDVEVRSVADQTLQHTLSTEVDRITGLCWSGNRVVACDEGGRIMVWDAASGDTVATLESNTPLRAVTAINLADTVAAIDDQRRPIVWKIKTSENESASFEVQSLEATASISDATRLALTEKPSPMLLVATESAGVLWINLADGKQIRSIDHGSVVDAMAVNHDGTQLATGGRDGKTRTWALADGKPQVTMEGDPRGQILLARASNDADRQKQAVARLEAKTEVLKKTLASEEEALTKVSEEHNKASEAFAAEQKKYQEAVAQVTATETTIQKAKQEAVQATETIQASEKTLAASESLTQKLTTELQAQAASLTKANEAAAAAQKQIEAATLALETAKAEATKLAEEVAKREAEIAKANEQAAQAKQKIEQANQTIAANKTAAEKATKDLEAQKKAVTDADAAKKKSEDEVAKRKQALETATLAKQRAADAIPEHEQQIDVAARRRHLLEQRLAGLQAVAGQPANAVVDIVYGPDAVSVATAHAGGEVRLYRSDDGTPLSSHQWSRDFAVGGVCFLDDQKIAAFSRLGAPQVWLRQPDWVLEHSIGSVNASPISDRVTALDFRPDGLSLAVGSGPPSRSGQVLIFSVVNGDLVRDFGEVHSDTVLGVEFSPDGRSLASSAADKTVRLLDIASGEETRSLEGHTHHVLSLAWQDDAQTIASASADQNIKVWDVNTGEQRRTISGFSKEITAIAFVGRTSQVITACADGQVRLHDSANGKSIRSFNAGGDFLFSLAVTPDGQNLVAGGQSGLIRVWNVADGKLVHEWK